MRTTGARDEWATSAARERCPRSCTPAVVRPCCCTYCCTGLTLTRQASTTGLSPTSAAYPVLASDAGVLLGFRLKSDARQDDLAPSLAGYRPSMAV
jgi:hypothetical protein